jgi:hypothetical protein
MFRDFLMFLNICSSCQIDLATRHYSNTVPRLKVYFLNDHFCSASLQKSIGCSNAHVCSTCGSRRCFCCILASLGEGLLANEMEKSKISISPTFGSREDHL